MPTEHTATSSTRIAIVTGGSRGLGRNTVLSLAKRGVDSIFTYHANRTEADNVMRAVREQGQRASRCNSTPAQPAPSTLSCKASDRH